jgi:hypothetical protein
VINIGTQNHAEIFNNYCRIQLSNPSQNGLFTGGDPIFVNDGCTGMVYNNLTHGGQNGVRAPSGVRVCNNFYFDSEGSMLSNERGGSVGVDSVRGDPLFVVGEVPKLEANSPCRDGGIDDPIYNDLDGSRNDIGPSGGAWFDPDGWTTDKPVVISFDLGPRFLQEGVNTEVNLTEGQAVAQP